jgi:nanoRNase/pAp phosphatase (c-di-AMP/oligoRNAs hydrolase)
MLGLRLIYHRENFCVFGVSNFPFDVKVRKQEQYQYLAVVVVALPELCTILDPGSSLILLRKAYIDHHVLLVPRKRG